MREHRRQQKKGGEGGRGGSVGWLACLVAGSAQSVGALLVRPLALLEDTSELVASCGASQLVLFVFFNCFEPSVLQHFLKSLGKGAWQNTGL